MHKKLFRFAFALGLVALNPSIGLCQFPDRPDEPGNLGRAAHDDAEARLKADGIMNPSVQIEHESGLPYAKTLKSGCVQIDVKVYLRIMGVPPEATTLDDPMGVLQAELSDAFYLILKHEAESHTQPPYDKETTFRPFLRGSHLQDLGCNYNDVCEKIKERHANNKPIGALCKLHGRDYSKDYKNFVCLPHPDEEKRNNGEEAGFKIEKCVPPCPPEVYVQYTPDSTRDLALWVDKWGEDYLGFDPCTGEECEE